jgi:hypothetical protein
LCTAISQELTGVISSGSEQYSSIPMRSSFIYLSLRAYRTAGAFARKDQRAPTRISQPGRLGQVYPKHSSGSFSYHPAFLYQKPFWRATRAATGSGSARCFWDVHPRDGRLCRNTRATRRVGRRRTGKDRCHVRKLEKHELDRIERRTRPHDIEPGQTRPSAQ